MSLEDERRREAEREKGEGPFEKRQTVHSILMLR